MEEKTELCNISRDNIGNQLDILTSGSGKRKFGRFIMGALGSIPWIGGIIAAGAAAHAEQEQGRTNELHKLWLEEHREKLAELSQDIAEIIQRLDGLYDNLKQRIESDEYMTLVKKAFRSWDYAGTKEKRHYIKNLIVNAAATELCVDDLVRLFNDWLDAYHEVHFKVIREIYNHPGITRGQIWDNANPKRPQENSADADLFKRLIRDLSIGGVIRQEREVNFVGEFIRNRQGNRSSRSDTYESAFEDTKPYELTELGKQFVHYTMTDIVRRIEQAPSGINN